MVTESAKVESSFLEYQAYFEEPIFEAWEKPHSILSAVFRAMRKWNLALDRVSQKVDQPNLGAGELEFHLLDSRLVFKVGLGGLSFSLSNPDWSEKETVLAQVEAALAAVTESTGAVTQRQLTTMGIHLRPAVRTPREIAATFLDMTSLATRFGEIQGVGFSLYQADSFRIVDQSWVHPGSLFLKIQRGYSTPAPLRGIADRLYADEVDLLAALELKLD